MFPKFFLHRAGANNDDWQSGAMDRIEQNVQAFVISQHPDKEKETIADAPTPIIEKLV